jgi:peptidoglycan hydrolase-like protein with peptidoglycan-binding domain
MLKRSFLGIAVMLLLTLGIYAQGDAPSAKKEETKAAASDTASKTTAFRPTKEQIRKGQEILIAQKLWTGEATGIYGESRPAVKAYQKANGLEQNGKFDRPTLAKMGIPLTDNQKGIGSASSSKRSSSSKSSSGEAKRAAPFRATKDQIAALQKVLKNEKLFSGEANGERSDELKDAVKKYQSAHGLNATGGINAATLEKAGIALTDSQKAGAVAQKTADTEKKN